MFLLCNQYSLGMAVLSAIHLFCVAFPLAIGIYVIEKAVLKAAVVDKTRISYFNNTLHSPEELSDEFS
jgi:hypothetical protein